MHLKKVTRPTIPVDIFLQEAENLFLWCSDDLYELEKVGIEREKIEQIPVYAEQCRNAQAIWIKKQNTEQETRTNRKSAIRAAFELRKDLLRTFRYAFRNSSEFNPFIKSVTKGTTYANLVQDLNDLSVFGQKHISELESIGFNPERLTLAAQTSEAISNLLAEIQIQNYKLTETKLLRDQAFTRLYTVVNEIRQAGQYIFSNKPERYIGYVSQYWKNKNRLNRKKPDNTTEV